MPGLEGPDVLSLKNSDFQSTHTKYTNNRGHSFIQNLEKVIGYVKIKFTNVSTEVSTLYLSKTKFLNSTQADTPSISQDEQIELMTMRILCITRNGTIKYV